MLMACFQVAVVSMSLCFDADTTPSVFVGAKKTSIADLANTFAKQHGLSDAEHSEEDAQRLLAKHFVSLSLGIFDLRYPVTSLADAKRGRELNEIAALLVKMQQNWVEWMGAEAAVQTEVNAAADALGKWLKLWRPGDLARSVDKNGDERDPLVLLKADAAIVKAANSLSDIMTVGKYLGAPRPSELRIPVVISPTRADFVQLASYVGSLSDSNKAMFWVTSMPTWSDLRWGDLTVLALEYAQSSRDGVDILKGLGMNEREPTGMLQNIAHKLMTSLAAHDLAKALDAPLHQALITNMVIELLGENNVTLGAGNATTSYQRFVPGGRSSGGKLPKHSAEGRFRELKGKDHFVGILHEFFAESAAQRAKQKSTEQEAERIAFALYARDDNDPHFIEAPFLEATALKRTLPGTLELDYAEFLRAYGSAFLYWLQDKAVIQSNTPKSMAQALFKAATATPEGQAFGFAQKVQEIYGIPWSSTDAKADSLEMRFLRWLTKA